MTCLWQLGLVAVAGGAAAACAFYHSGIMPSDCTLHATNTQSVMLVELDGPRPRTVGVQVVGQPWGEGERK